MPLAQAARTATAKPAEVDRAGGARRRRAKPAAKPETPKPAGKLRDLKDPFAN